jgi:hypothetical protein
MIASETRELVQAGELIEAFAERTGLTTDQPGPRYLWTDAFAVCSLLGLARATGEQRWRELALRLVERVHAELGRHRPDDVRRGWLSGLGEREGEEHPTRGGLRIGKRLPERRPDQPYDDRLEWDRDGQYFHYLTKWMHALDQLARATRELRFNLWARELAETAHAAFCFRPRAGAPPRMAWKLSIDLSRPLVASMGQHDPLDGFLTCAQLMATAAQLGAATSSPSLARASADFEALLDASELRTDDALGVGGLLSDACRLRQLIECGASARADLLERLVGAAREGVERWALLGELDRPASRRLGFRELGLAIGLGGAHLYPRLAESSAYARLGAAIRSFWLDPENRRAATWTAHRDISEVMLATSLVPEGFLALRPPPP